MKSEIVNDLKFLAYFWTEGCSRISKMVFPGVNTDADVCFAVVVNVVALVNQDQDQLADLSVAFCSSYNSFAPRRYLQS